MNHIRALRYLLLWPLVRLVRNRSRQRLTWRLAVSHLITVLLTLVTVFILMATVGLAVTLAVDPASVEPASDAKAVATVLGGDLAAGSLDEEPARSTVAVLLGALARRDLKLDKEIGAISFEIESPRRLAHVRAISIVGEDGRVVVSSDHDLVGRHVTEISSTALDAVGRALSGSGDRRANSIVRQEGASAAVGRTPSPADPAAAMPCWWIKPI